MNKPPIEFLVDSFQYSEPVGRNDWNEPIYSEVITVDNCRIDREAVFTSSASGKQLLYNAIIFCYTGRTNPMPEFKTEGKVEFDGKEHQIQKVIPIKEPYRDEIYAFEIEVL